MFWVIRVDNLCSIYMESFIRCEFTQTDEMDGLKFMKLTVIRSW